MKCKFKGFTGDCWIADRGFGNACDTVCDAETLDKVDLEDK